MAVLVEGLVRLGNTVVVFDVSGHVDDFVEDLAGLFVDLPERRFDEAVLVDAGKGGKIGDQTDVRTFGGLDGTHAAVMGVVNVSDFESGTVSGKTAGAEGGETTLMREFCQGVRLVHELGQRRGAEELLDGSDDGTDVDESFRSRLLGVLCGERHSLADDTFHTGETDAELVLEQFADGTDAAVAQMVDVVKGTDIVAEAVKVVDGGIDVVDDDVFRDEVIGMLFQSEEQVVLVPVVLCFGEDVLKDAEPDFFIDADFFQFVFRQVPGAEEREDVDHAVGNDFDFFPLFGEDISFGDTGLFDLVCLLGGDDVTGVGKELTGLHVDDFAGELLAGQTLGDPEFLIIFIAAYAGQVVTAGVEEQVVEMLFRSLNCRRLARAQSLVDFQECFFTVFRRVLLEGRKDPLVRTEEIEDLFVAGKAQSTNEGRDRDLSVLVDADIEHIVLVRLIFEPGTSVRDNGGRVEFLTGLIMGHTIIHAGRTDQLRNDGTLRTVDDEGTAIRHDRELAHLDDRLLDESGLLVGETRGQVDAGRIGGPVRLALLDGVFGFFIHGIVDELEDEITGVVGNFPDVSEDFLQTDIQEPLIRILLDLDEVRHLHDFIDLSEIHTSGCSELGRFNVYHKP